MNLIDEQNITLFQIGQKRGQIPRLGDHRPRGGAKIDPQLPGDDLRQCGFAKPRRSGEQNMIERLAAGFRSLNEHPQIGPRLRLPNEFFQHQRP